MKAKYEVAGYMLSETSALHCIAVNTETGSTSGAGQEYRQKQRKFVKGMKDLARLKSKLLKGEPQKPAAAFLLHFAANRAKVIEDKGRSRPQQGLAAQEH